MSACSSGVVRDGAQHSWQPLRRPAVLVGNRDRVVDRPRARPSVFLLARRFPFRSSSGFLFFLDGSFCWGLFVAGSHWSLPARTSPFTTLIQKTILFFILLIHAE